MFSNLPQHEREAFFDIMDEYFSQRPQLDPIAMAEAHTAGPSHIASTSRTAPPPAVPIGNKPGMAPAQSPAAALAAVMNRQAPEPEVEQGDPDAIGYAEAIFPYPKSEADDLAVAKGERIVLIEKISDDWWRGRSMDGQRREGIVPSAYVTVL